MDAKLETVISAIRRKFPGATVSVEKQERNSLYGLFSAMQRNPRVYDVTDGVDVALDRVVLCVRAPRDVMCEVGALFLMFGVGRAMSRATSTLPHASFESNLSVSPIRDSPRKKEKRTTWFIHDFCHIQPYRRQAETLPKKQRRRDQKRLNRSMQRRDQRRGTPPNGAPSVHRTGRRV